jgi:hypothetical protein
MTLFGGRINRPSPEPLTTEGVGADADLSHGQRAARSVRLECWRVPTGSRQTQCMAQIGVGANSARATLRACAARCGPFEGIPNLPPTKRHTRPARRPLTSCKSVWVAGGAIATRWGAARPPGGRGGEHRRPGGWGREAQDGGTAVPATWGPQAPRGRLLPACGGT